MPVNPKRARIIVEGKESKGPVAYWMSRDQRTKDNWALLFAQELAKKEDAPLAVVFCLVPEFLEAALRQYFFMLKGLKEVQKLLSGSNIPFYLLCGSPETEISNFISDYNVSTLVTDFNPMRIKRQWMQAVASGIDIPFYEVDAHNIVPCWIASQKQEYAAYTFRPKIHRALTEFLEEFPSLCRHPISWGESLEVDWNRASKTLRIDRDVPEVGWILPGEAAACKTLCDFMSKKLSQYGNDRNNPLLDGQSNLSPYLHFGQISAQRVALEVLLRDRHEEAFLEELIVRRELSDNFCLYNAHYDSEWGFPVWAKKSLDEHLKDEREYIYDLGELEWAQTHDDLWNASQMEMVKGGKMHGYLRMYWAKKILEWSSSPQEALKQAIYLNDKYEIDGRDPNGYTGIAWSIGGVHDRAWKERKIFGKVRYMSGKGVGNKFNAAAYVEKISALMSEEP